MNPNTLGLLKPWAIGAVTATEQLQGNVLRITASDGRNLVLKEVAPVSDQLLERIQFEYDVLAHVVRCGVRAAVPLLTVDGAPYSVTDGLVYKLADWLPNRPAPVMTAQEQIALNASCGRAIATMHVALASYQDERLLSRTWQTDLNKRVFGEALPVLNESLGPADRNELAGLQAQIETGMSTAFAGLPGQLILWDCHQGNTAVDGHEVVGFLDCDLMCVAPRVFDVAYMLVHMIKWTIGDAAAEQAWLAHAVHVVRGYETVLPLSPKERNALFYVMAGVPLIFMDWFAKTDNTGAIATEMRLFRWLVQSRGEIVRQFSA